MRRPQSVYFKTRAMCAVWCRIGLTQTKEPIRGALMTAIAQSLPTTGQSATGRPTAKSKWTTFKQIGPVRTFIASVLPL